MVPKEIEVELARLSRAEKAEVLARLAREIANIWPGIEKSADVAGGEACIVRTRIPVWVLENYRRLGVSEAELLVSYPALHAADLVNAWAYADMHRADIDAAIVANEVA